jgi:hypothetical protein
MNTAWLIGAGFSCQLDMPLVWPLTTEIKSWLTPTKLRELNIGWTQQRLPVAEVVIVAACDHLAQVEETYEQLIGWFQTQRRRILTQRGPIYEGYRHLTGLVQSAVGEILFRRHASAVKALEFMLPWYRGIEAAVPHEAPLWIFSLNHDVCLEAIACELAIPVSCGYAEPNVVSFPTRDGRRVSFDRLRNERLTAYDLEFAKGRAINLVKLHGSLDVFWYGDLRDYVRVHPQSLTAAGWLASLHDLEEQLPAVENGQRVVTPGEIPVHDDTRELQFLRRTLVAGAFKFERGEHYNAPSELVEFFGKKLAEFDTLVVIGYGWADPHINAPIEQWLAADPARRVVDVNPRGLSQNAAHLASRVEQIKLGAAEYLASLRPTPIAAAEQRKRSLRDLLRTIPDAAQRFDAAMKTAISQRLGEAVTRLGARVGNATTEEIGKEALEMALDQDALVEIVLQQLQDKQPSPES